MTRALPDIRCVVPGHDTLGETPLWCSRTQSLLWLDIDAARLSRFHPSSGRIDRFDFDARHAGSLALTRNVGTVLIGLDLGLHLFDLGEGRLTPLAQVEDAALDNRLNDGRVDARGRFWVGSMDNQLRSPTGAFYRVDADGSVHRQFGDVIVSNTVAFSPSNDRLYFSDTRRFITWRFDLSIERGELGERRVFVDHRAESLRPDGACVDAQGHVWTALFGSGRLLRLAPDGTVERSIELPVTNPTCVCLGGPQLRTLYVTTARKFLGRTALRHEPLAGSVLSIEVDVPGLEEHRFERPPETR